MNDPLDKLAEWRGIADRATEGPWPVNGSRFGELGQVWGLNWRNDNEFIATSRTAMPALLAAIENVLNLRYDDCPLGSTEGHEGWCDALVEVRDAIRDALGGAK